MLVADVDLCRQDMMCNWSFKLVSGVEEDSGGGSEKVDLKLDNMDGVHGDGDGEVLASCITSIKMSD